MHKVSRFKAFQSLIDWLKAISVVDWLVEGFLSRWSTDWFASLLIEVIGGLTGLLIDLIH